MPLFLGRESSFSLSPIQKAYAYLLTAGSRGGASVSQLCHKVGVRMRVDCPCHCSSQAVAYLYVTRHL